MHEFTSPAYYQCPVLHPPDYHNNCIVNLGARVIMACRSASRTQDAIDSIKNQSDGDNNVGELVFKYLELSFLASVRKCAKEILHSEKRIDILVNNAGETCCENHNII